MSKKKKYASKKNKSEIMIKPRLRWTLEDKRIIAEYQGQFDIFGQVICKMCGRSFPIDVMEVDHIKPISKGGTDKPSNLQLLCPVCNRKKGAKKSKKVHHDRTDWFISFFKN